MSDKKETATPVESKSKFEQMLEKVVADDRTGADDIFHEIVVEKSRKIYEDLLEDDIKEVDVPEASKDEKTAEATTTEATKEDKAEEKADAKEEDTKEATKEDDKKDEEVKEKSKEDQKDEKATSETLVDIQPVEQPQKVELAPVATPTPTEDGIGGDATDDMVGDIEVDKDNGDEAPSDGEDLEDRVVDLEDAIDELKAEFDAMMSDGGDDAEAPADDEAGDDEEGSDDAEEEGNLPTSELGSEEQKIVPRVESKQAQAKSPTEEMREYVNKVSAKTSDGTDNSKSPVASKGGASTTEASGVKISGSEEKGGKAPKAKQEDAGNVNKPGASAAKLHAAKGSTADGTDGSSNKSAIGS